MQQCQNCESFVTTRYARVFTPPDVNQPRACPNCTDKVRTGATVRDTHGQNGD